MLKCSGHPRVQAPATGASAQCICVISAAMSIFKTLRMRFLNVNPLQDGRTTEFPPENFFGTPASRTIPSAPGFFTPRRGLLQLHGVLQHGGYDDSVHKFDDEQHHHR